MNGATTKGRVLKLSDGSHVKIVIPNGKFNPGDRSWKEDVYYPNYNEDLIQQGIAWFNRKHQTSAVLYMKFSNRKMFINYVNVIGL